MKNSTYAYVLYFLLFFTLSIHSMLADGQDTLYAWKFSCGPIYARPVVNDSVAYFGSRDRNFYAVNIRNGKEIWHFTADTINSIAAVKNNVVVFESKNRLYGLNALTGKKLWSFTNNDHANVAVGFTDYHHSSPVIVNNTVVFCDQFGFVNVVNLGDGKLLSRYQIDSKQPIRSTPAVKDGIVYLGDWTGNIYAISLKKPSLVWKHKMDSVREYYGAVVSEMVIRDNLLFFGSQHDVSSPLDIKTGKPVWKYFDPKHTYLPSTPVFKGNKMYIATTIFANKVYCFDYKKGPDKEWEFQAEGIFFTTPIIKDSVLIINSSLHFDLKTSMLYFINCNNGKLLGQLKYTNMCPGFPLLYNNTLFLGMNDGLYAANARALFQKAQAESDSFKIIGTSKDYIEGWYDGDTTRMNKALHPDLVKRRYDFSRNELNGLTKPMMMSFTKAGYGKKTPREKIRNEFMVLDIYGNMASAKAVSCDFVDYMQLLRVDGEWKIVNVLWDFKSTK